MGTGRPALRLALKADYDAGLLPGILDAYDALPVELVLGGYLEQIVALREGRADVALVATTFDGRGLDSEPLITGPRVVALAASDPLAARTSLRLSDLAGRLLPNGMPAEQWFSGTTGGQYRPLDLSQIFNLIEVGSAVWFLPAWLAERTPRPGIAYRPLEGAEPVTLSVVWPAASRSTAVAAFVRVAQEAARNAGFPAVVAGTSL
ncbi:LysR substrate-binding domain-containing protein [Kineosporia mesophila]|nr:LysR substrate-binding domain-containing protein [Kineosporia mesophila]